MNSMRHLKRLLQIWAGVFLVILAGFLFVSVTPWLINQPSDLGIPLAILMWVTFVYCVGTLAINLAHKNKDNK